MVSSWTVLLYLSSGLQQRADIPTRAHTHTHAPTCTLTHIHIRLTEWFQTGYVNLDISGVEITSWLTG